MPNTVIEVFEPSVFDSGLYFDFSVSKIDRVSIANRRIYLKAGVTSYHPVDHIYKEFRFLRREDSTLTGVKTPVSAGGNVPKGGGKFTPRYAVFNDGWKIVPQNITHSLYVEGEQITNDGQSGPACLDTSVLDPNVNVTIHYEPPAAELIQITVGGIGTVEEVRAAVWDSEIPVTPTANSYGQHILKKLLTVAKYIGLK